MMKKSGKLPKDIIQLVNKGNFVIAIKTLSEKENISLDEAKQRIDDYETQQLSKKPVEQPKKPVKQAKKPESAREGFDELLAAVDDAIEAKGVSSRVITKRYRLAQFFLLIALLIVFFWFVF